MKLTVCAVALMTILAPSAHAQILPFFVTKGTRAAGRAQLFNREQMMRGREEKACEKFGCLVIMNTSVNFDIVGFYLDTREPGDEGPPRWGPNQFANIRLAPNQATFTVKIGDASMCGVLARAVLRHRKTGEEIEAEVGAVDLCVDPERRNSLLPIKVVQPTVSVDNPAD